MDKLLAVITNNAQRIQDKVRTEPMNVIHLPSFVLGCFFVISLSLIGPFLKVFIGNVLLTVITIIKYAVVVAGIAACITLARKNGDSTSTENEKCKERTKKCKVSMEVPNGTDKIEEFEDVQDKKLENELARDDFETIKYYNIPVTKSHRRDFPVNNAYDSFINRAAINTDK